MGATENRDAATTSVFNSLFILFSSKRRPRNGLFLSTSAGFRECIWYGMATGRARLQLSGGTGTEPMTGGVGYGTNIFGHTLDLDTEISR